MHLTNQFRIPTAPDRAYELLLDLTRVAPCVPGADLGELQADGSYTGTVSVRLGPMTFNYGGRVRIIERDPGRRSAVIVGEGRASQGADTATMRTSLRVVADGDGSLVEMETDLVIKGRAAQMGQGIVADVSTRLVKSAAACIEARLMSPDDGEPPVVAPAPIGGISLMASLAGERVARSVRRIGHKAGSSDHDGDW